MCHHFDTVDVTDLEADERAELLAAHDEAELEAAFSEEELEALSA